MFEAKMVAKIEHRESSSSGFGPDSDYCFFEPSAGDAGFLAAKVRLAGGGGFSSQTSLK
jgi:hypothetical protein